MKKVLVLLLFLSTIGFASLARTIVNVADSNGRPIKDASVVFSCTIIEYEQAFPPPSYLPTSVPHNRTIHTPFGSTTVDGITYPDTTQYIDCAVDSPISTNVTYQGLTAIVNGTFKASSNSITVIIPDLYDLQVKVADQSNTPISNVTVTSTPAENPDIFKQSGKTDESGTVIFRQIPDNSNILLWLKKGNEEKSLDVRINGNTNINVVMGTITNATAQTNTSNETAPSVNKSAVIDWFVYLMNETDRLIGEYKKNHQKMRVVFVPIGYSDNESEEFKDLARSSLGRFVTVSPFRECKYPQGEIEVEFIEPSQCNLTKCSDDCGLGDNISENCQFLIKNCSGLLSKSANLILGLCKNRSCGVACGCAGGIPSQTAVTNTADCSGISVPEAVSHETGHALGLYHIRSQMGLNGCWDNEYSACKGHNAADCELPPENRSKLIMTYCPDLEDYGPAGYMFLKNTTLANFVGECK